MMFKGNSMPSKTRTFPLKFWVPFRLIGSVHNESQNTIFFSNNFLPKLVQFRLVLNLWMSFSCLQWQPDLVPLVSVTSKLSLSTDLLHNFIMRCIFLHPSHLESCGHLRLLDRGLVDPFRISSALLVRTRWLAFCLFDLRSERFSHLTKMGCAASVTPVTPFTSPVPAVCKDSSASTAAPAPLFTVSVTWQEFSGDEKLWWNHRLILTGDILTSYDFFASFSCEHEGLQHLCIRGLGNCYEDICYIYIFYLFDLFVRRHVMSSCIQYQCIPVLVYQCISPCLFGRQYINTLIY